MMKYICEPVSSLEEWDRMVCASPQGTLFSESFYLSACQADHEMFVIRQGQKIKAGLCVILTEDHQGCRLDDLVIHNGLLFVPDVTQKPVRARSERFEITEFVIHFLDSRYKSIALALSPCFEDMRPFLWHNYHDPVPGKKFVLDLRYTSYVNIGSLKERSTDFEKSACFLSMETLRQRHIRQAYKQKAQVHTTNDASRFITYYRALMERQGDPVSGNKLGRMEMLINALLAKDRARIYEVQNYLSDIVYTVIYSWDAQRAYYLFGAGHPEMSEAYQGTLAHWSAFVDLANRLNVYEVDMEGVNSPRRGWFKLGFGGDLRTYFQVYK